VVRRKNQGVWGKLKFRNVPPDVRVLGKSVRVAIDTAAFLFGGKLKRVSLRCLVNRTLEYSKPTRLLDVPMLRNRLKKGKTERFVRHNF
jgi:hypothetical protein